MKGKCTPEYLADVPELALVLALVPRSSLLVVAKELVPVEHACPWCCAQRRFTLERGEW